MKLLGALIAILLFFSTNIFADTKMEIDHLLDFVAKTTCKYERNGTLHAGPEAKEHILITKRRYTLLKTSSFIRPLKVN